MAFWNFFRGKKVLVTGHTGFKGAWLAHWLIDLGAEVHGISLEPPTNPSLFVQLGLRNRLHHNILDIRRSRDLAEKIHDIRPDCLFHLAAQALVRSSYRAPLETYETNLMGTLNVLEALRQTGEKCAVVIVTSDKCYQNAGLSRGYAEDDRLGGHDPYSSSKACAELALASWRSSFFKQGSAGGIALASARAGNVVGGGDWAEDRLLPDCIRALSRDEPIAVRNRNFTRPWQHVLEALSGYLCLMARLSVQGPESELCTPFNFGPPPESNQPVSALVEEVLKNWPGNWRDAARPDDPHEAELLYVVADKARRLLGWQSVWSFEKCVARTVQWYREADLSGAAESAVLRELSSGQVREYLSDARAEGQEWACDS